MAFCIPKNLVNAFLNQIKSGEVTPEGLIKLGSEGRRKFFEKTLGEDNAFKVNTLFESKLLLKNQKRGMINWVNKIRGLKPAAKRDLLSRVDRMDRILTPETETGFLQDLASQRLGVAVTELEAGNIVALAQDVKVNRQILEEGGNRMFYGRSKIAFDDYVGGLKNEETALKLRDFVKPNNTGETILNVGRGFVNTAGFFKSIKATFDNSVIGRQGLKIAFTNPDIWLKNSKQTFVDIFNTFRGKEVMKEIRADIISRPNSLNGKYKGKPGEQPLAVNVREEEIPVDLSKVPFLGKAFAASENAFSGFILRTRADVFDRLTLTAEKTNADISGLGEFVNSLSGRGSLGVLEGRPANLINVLFFSARFVRSNIDVVTGFQGNIKASPFVRQQGALASVKIIGGIATVLAVTNAICPDCVEENPISTDFGKIKVGNSRFAVDGGISAQIVLASRLITQSKKSATTGTIKSLRDTKFKSDKSSDLIGRFVGGKLAPGLGLIKMLLDGETYFGDPLTPGRVAFETLLPISITTAVESYQDPKSANILLAIIADASGIGVNTYGPEVKWINKTTKEMIQFQKVLKNRNSKTADKVFKQANDDYNKLWSDWIERRRKDSTFKALSNEDQFRAMTKKRSEFKKEIFRRNSFKPKREKLEKLPEFE